MKKTEEDIASVPVETLKKLFTAGLRPMEPVPTVMTPGGALRTPLKGILFDVYGTLLISGTGDISVARKSVHASKNLEALLEKFGISTAPEKLLGAFFNEIDHAHQAAKQEGTDFPEVQIDRIWSRVLGIGDMTRAQRFAIEFELLANPVWPMPHLEALIAACRKAGLPMGIVSNAQFYTPLLLRWFLKKTLGDLGFVEDLLIYSFEVGCAKPSPRLFSLASGKLEAMGIPPNTVLYVGNDMKKDILPANEAGFQTALFAGDARSLRPGDSKPAPEDIRADLVVTNLGQLLPYVAGDAVR